jgi:DNA-directed RNA polymerase
VVHDSFATTAVDTENLARAIREQFVELYGGNNDWLKAFRDEAQAFLRRSGWTGAVPEPPEQGDFHIESVRESEYIFA